MVNIKRKVIFNLLFLILFIFVLNPMIANGQGLKVFDDANLFSNEEINILEDEAKGISNEYDMDIIIVTTNNDNGKEPRECAHEYFEDNELGVGNESDGILFLIDMYNREPYLLTSGKGIKYLTDERLENIIDIVFDNGLVDGDYYSAAKAYLISTKEYLERGIPLEQYSEDENVETENSLTFIEGLISLISGLGISSVFIFGTKSKYKMKNPVKPLTFRDNSITNLQTVDDRLIDTIVTHRTIPKPSSKSNSGKSTTHTSSSGKTYGGTGSKGRKF